MPRTTASAESVTAVWRPGLTVARLTGRKAARSGVLWGYVFGIFVASTALGVAATYKTAAERARLAATFATNSGIDAIIGRAHDVQTVAGFTAWRSMGVLSIVGAVWGVLAGTRLLRGEEDAGRWELLLAGGTTRAGATGQGLVGLGAGAGVLFALTAAITVVVGRFAKVHLGTGAALFLALSLVAGAVMFLAVGALGSQVAGTRRRAAMYGGIVIAVSFLVRLVADSTTGLGWLRWATPFGWIENLQPVAHPSPLALLPIAGLSALAGILAVWFAGRRDLGASILVESPGHAPHTWLLAGQGRLALRLVGTAVPGWLAATFVLAFVMGFIAKAAGNAVTASSSARHALARLGASGTGPRVFLGATLLIVALLIALCAASQVSGVRASEGDGLLENLLVRPVGRRRWLGTSLGVSSAALVVCGAAAALAAWAGGAVQHAGVSFSTLLGAGVNLVTPALCVLGVGVLVLGTWPRATAVVSYGLVSWAFLIDFIGGVAGLNHWLLDTSLLHQISAAPAEPVRWASDGIVVAIGAAAASVGLVAFSRRDLAGA